MGVGFVFFKEPELNWSALKRPAFAEFALQVAAVAPVQEFGVRAKDFEGWRGVVGFLHHVVEFGGAVFEAGGRVLVDDLAEPAV